MLAFIRNFWIARVEAWHIKRGTFDQYREHFIIHKRKTQWIFSGTSRTAAGFRNDEGFVRSPKEMNRAQALRYFRRNFSKLAEVLHVDDRNKIITYRIAQDK